MLGLGRGGAAPFGAAPLLLPVGVLVFLVLHEGGEVVALLSALVAAGLAQHGVAELVELFGCGHQAIAALTASRSLYAVRSFTSWPAASRALCTASPVASACSCRNARTMLRRSLTLARGCAGAVCASG